MRIPYSTLAGVLGAMAGLVATAAIADNLHPKAQKPTCGCAVSAASSSHHHKAHHRLWRRAKARGPHHHRFVDHRAGHGGWANDHGWGDARGWGDERSWESERGWHEEHGWGKAAGGMVEAWTIRPWATDAFGFLTWPGKTHFGPPTPPPPEMGPPPPGMDGPPPPPPPPAERGEAYRIYRF